MNTMALDLDYNITFNCKELYADVRLFEYEESWNPPPTSTSHNRFFVTTVWMACNNICNISNSARNVICQSSQTMTIAVEVLMLISVTSVTEAAGQPSLLLFIVSFP